VANGKAYEMLSNLVGVCELYRTNGDYNLLTPVLNAWQDIVDKRLYITGSASQGEVFRDDFVLPNDMKPNVGETCVTVTWLQLNAQLLRLTNESRFADELEKTVYNHLLGAQKPSGDQWCYYTSLEGTKPYTGQTNCCLSSGPRGLALTPSFIYGVDTEHSGIVVNLYETGQANLVLPNGKKVLVQQQTFYPSNGDVQITVNPEEAVKFPLMMRIPPWCPGEAITVHINNNPYEVQWKPGYYGILLKKWKPGDKVVLHLDVRLRVVEGNQGNAGKVAITFGPMVLAGDEGSNPKLKPLKQVSLFNTPMALSVETLPASETRPVSSDYNIYQVRACTGDPGKPAKLRLMPFAEVGKDGSSFQVWFTEAGADCAKKE